MVKKKKEKKRKNQKTIEKKLSQEKRLIKLRNPKRELKNLERNLEGLLGKKKLES